MATEQLENVETAKCDQIRKLELSRSGYCIRLEIDSKCQQLEGKGKAVPLQVWSGPEGSRKLRFPDFMTTALDGCKVVSLTHRPSLPPGNTPGTHFC